MRTPVKGAWTTGLCECCQEPSGCGFCLYAWCCSCCAYGSIVELMEPVVCCGGECCGACMAYAGMTCIGCPCILHMMARGYIRNKYNIPGSGCGDFMVTWCCTPCAMCQEHRELRIRGHSKDGVIQGDKSLEAPQLQQMVLVPVVQAPQVPQASQPVVCSPAPQPGAYPPQPAAYPPAAPQPQTGYPVAQPGYPAAAPQGYYPTVPTESKTA